MVHLCSRPVRSQSTQRNLQNTKACGVVFHHRGEGAQRPGFPGARACARKKINRPTQRRDEHLVCAIKTAVARTKPIFGVFLACLASGAPALSCSMPNSTSDESSKRGIGMLLGVRHVRRAVPSSLTVLLAFDPKPFTSLGHSVRDVGCEASTVSVAVWARPR